MFPTKLVLLVEVINLTVIYCQDPCRPSGSSAETSPWMQLLGNKNYSPQVPPTVNTEGPDEVYVALQILDVDEVDENQMYFQIQIFLITTWIDPRLVTDQLAESNFMSHHRLLIPDDAMKCFWTPSVIFDNNKDGKMFMLSVPNTMLAVYKNKTVLKASRFSVKVRCRFDLSRYPMDIQRCQFRMRLFDEPDDLVTLRWMDQGNSPLKYITEKAIEVNSHIKPTRFRLEISTGWNKTKWWLNSQFTYLGVNITFNRLLTSSLLTIYIPSTLIVSLSWVSFWIDVQGIPGRVSLGIMSILTIITQILDIRKTMPPVSYVTAIDIWLFGCLVYVFLSLVEYAFAYNHIKNTTPVPLDDEKENFKSVATTLNGITRIAWTPIAMVNKPEAGPVTLNSVMKKILTIGNFSANQFGFSQLDNNSKLVFPSTFVIFALVYWTYYIATSAKEWDAFEEL
ncbi:Gamma-aminobutyric acid receptor subunit rho-2 [Halotydeus destructor]|nr:Gamma-aminobutyric acid receptor subunit rho-2 [Halotydeus destructor]